MTFGNGGFFLESSALLSLCWLPASHNDFLLNLAAAVHLISLQLNLMFFQQLNVKLWQVFSRDRKYRKFCMAHLFTYASFRSGVLGLAYIGSPRLFSVGGICSPRKINCGHFVCVLACKYVIKRSVSSNIVLVSLVCILFLIVVSFQWWLLFKFNCFMHCVWDVLIWMQPCRCCAFNMLTSLILNLHFTLCHWMVAAFWCKFYFSCFVASETIWVAVCRNGAASASAWCCAFYV